MMIIFASMLYERRIIFISKRLSRLSACVQACNALIYPMIWQHIYIPVLPLSLIDYLLAPMPFLIGVPTLTLQKIPKSDLGEVVILDADNNTIESPFQDLESLPQDVVTNLKKALRNRSTLLGDGVSRAFLRALVQLTAGYREALTLQQGERITFNQNAFVESRPSSMQPFLRKMLELQIFQQFIEERLNMLNSGLGFSDEFEMEACSYSAKSNSKFMQQYREWTYTMRKESSAFFRSVKDKANPAVKYAVKSVKDKGKDMKTAYKGLKWKGRPNSSETNMRFHQPRSAPNSPTLDRRPIGFTSPPKSPNGVSATTSYRKELRLRNSNFDASKKQYSPLNPSSPEESDSPPERINIDLMHELQDVIFPKIPSLDRTLKPVRSLDNLRPAWSGHLRHSPSPSTIVTNSYEVSSKKPILISSPCPLPSDTLFNQSKMLTSNLLTSNRIVKEVDKTSLLSMSSTSYNQNIDSNRFLHELNIHNNLIKPVADLSLCVHEKENPKTEDNFSSNNRKFICKDIFANSNLVSHTNSELLDKPYKTSNFFHKVNEDDPFDTSKVLMPIYVQTAPLFKSRIPSMPAPFHPLSQFNSTSCSAHIKDSSDVPDLIRLDSTTSNDDFDPLLSKIPELSSTKQMSQSLHLPEMNEGLSNPLYPYFQQSSHKNNDKPKVSDNVGDMDLLQAYGIDFSKFSLTNSDNPSIKNTAICNRSVPDNNINNVDTIDTFNLTLNTSAIKSPNNWTKFE
ncbi:uncharacterized protein [Anoplolepis gracilipes]